MNSLTEQSQNRAWNLGLTARLGSKSIKEQPIILEMRMHRLFRDSPRRSNTAPTYCVSRITVLTVCNIQVSVRLC